MAIEDLKYKSVTALLTACADSIRTKKKTSGLIDKQDLPDEILSIQDDSVFIDAIEGDIVDLTIPEGVTKIRDYAFYQCPSITSIAIPNSVTSIGSCAFLYCENIKHVKMSSTIKSIGQSAFASVNGCTFDFSNATSVPTLQPAGIEYVDKNTIVVPVNLHDKWISATNWSSLSDFIVTIDSPKFRNVYCNVDNEYGFVLNPWLEENTTYYQSGNAGINDSFSLCEIRCFSSGTKHLYLDCYQSSENNYDYAVIGKLDTILTDETVLDEDIFHSFKGFDGETTIDLGLIPEGAHFVRVKYTKDSSDSAGDDMFRFKVRME